MSGHIHSYPKVYNMGHPAITELLDGDVVVQEKYDGSQFSFGVLEGNLVMRSRGADIHFPTDDKLFRPAAQTAMLLFEGGKLTPGWVYRCECISKPKHNTLCYDRVPKGNLVLFDIETAPNTFMSPDRVTCFALDLGLEGAGNLYWGSGHSLSLPRIQEWLERISLLGGAKIEGVAIKNYSRFGRDGKVLMGKHVSEKFKETHQGEWKKSNPTGKDILGVLIDTFRTPARWQKAVQHLQDSGKLQHAPQDIGPLLGELSEDLKEECSDEIREILFKWAWKHVARGVGRGLPEWYKQRLLEDQFDLDAAKQALAEPGSVPFEKIASEPDAPEPESSTSGE